MVTPAQMEISALELMSAPMEFVLEATLSSVLPLTSATKLVSVTLPPDSALTLFQTAPRLAMITTSAPTMITAATGSALVLQSLVQLSTSATLLVFATQPMDSVPTRPKPTEPLATTTTFALAQILAKVASALVSLLLPAQPKTSATMLVSATLPLELAPTQSLSMERPVTTQTPALKQTLAKMVSVLVPIPSAVHSILDAIVPESVTLTQVIVTHLAVFATTPSVTIHLLATLEVSATS